MPPRRLPSPSHTTGLAVHAAVTAVLATVVTVIWVSTGGGYFWPGWAWIGLGFPLAVNAAVWAGLRPPDPRRRGIAIHGGVVGAIAALLVLVWLAAGAGAFWPAIPVTALALTVALHYIVAEAIGRTRERELTERVDELTRTRRGALEVQAAELRRVERDLHDGAQSRLVALSMQLGRAEARLGDQPEIAELVRQARDEAGAAIAELRDLARGIAPPVLADRGLPAAIESLARRSSALVEVDAELDSRPAPVIELAAYFVVAEALTNAAKHAPDAPVSVKLAVDEERLTVVVHDSGPGGADPAGSGLTGLRHRVEALDGRLKISSPRGGGTTIDAELPCVS